MDENLTNIKDRILKLPKILGVSIEKFMQSIGQSYANYKGKSKESSPSSDVLVTIMTKYPQVNVLWILTGQGSIFLGYENNDVENVISEAAEEYLINGIIEEKNAKINMLQERIEDYKVQVEELRQDKLTLTSIINRKLKV